jgi:hypothetical protein
MHTIVRQGNTAIAIRDFDIHFEGSYHKVKKGTRLVFKGKVRNCYGRVKVLHSDGYWVGFSSSAIMVINDKLIKLKNRLEVEINGLRNSDEELCI